MRFILRDIKRFENKGQWQNLRLVPEIVESLDKVERNLVAVATN